MAVSCREASRRSPPEAIDSGVGNKTRFYYGGPNPRFTQAYGWFLLCNCLYLFAAPLSVAGILLRDADQSIHSNVVFFGRLYGLAGAALCMQLLAEPILTKMQSLLTGLTACACSLVLMKNRQTMIQEMHLFWTLFFSLVGVYFIIRSPNARKPFSLRTACN